MYSYRSVLLCVLLALFALCGLPAQAVARVMILDNPIRLPFSGFASSMAVAGDLDGDGVSDYIIGAYDQPVTGNDHQGRVFIFSGQSGKLLLTIEDPTPVSWAAFGFAVAAAGDVNKDGTPDLLVGAFAQDGEGKAFVFDGQNGKLLRTLTPPQASGGSAFGWSVAGVGDVNKDGVPDILVGAPYTAVNEVTVQGRAYVFNGKDGKLL